MTGSEHVPKQIIGQNGRPGCSRLRILRRRAHGGRRAGPTDYIGLVLAFGMAFLMSAITVSAKFFPRSDAVRTSYLSAFLSAAAVAPFATFTQIGLHDLAWLGAYGAVNVGLGFALYLRGVARISAMSTSLPGLTEVPLTPIIWAWLLLDEALAVSTVAGGALILVSAIAYTVIDGRRNDAQRAGESVPAATPS